MNGGNLLMPFRHDWVFKSIFDIRWFSLLAQNFISLIVLELPSSFASTIPWADSFPICTVPPLLCVKWVLHYLHEWLVSLFFILGNLRTIAPTNSLVSPGVLVYILPALTGWKSIAVFFFILYFFAQIIVNHLIFIFWLISSWNISFFLEITHISWTFCLE